MGRFSGRSREAPRSDTLSEPGIGSTIAAYVKFLASFGHLSVQVAPFGLRALSPVKHFFDARPVLVLLSFHEETPSRINSDSF